MSVIKELMDKSQSSRELSQKIIRLVYVSVEFLIKKPQIEIKTVSLNHFSQRKYCELPKHCNEQDVG